MLSRAGVGTGILLVDAGSLADAPFRSTGRAAQAHLRDPLGPTTFNDAQRQLRLDDRAERRKRYNLAAAIEAPSKKKDKPTRASRTTACAPWCSPTPTCSAIRRGPGGPAHGALVADSVKWLGGEEAFAGETMSEKDVTHRAHPQQDVVWFYLSLVGAPLLFLGIGLVGVTWRRRRSQRRRS